jgi:hypothetical protein
VEIKRTEVYREVEEILYSYYHKKKKLDELEERYLELQEQIEKDDCISALTYSQIKIQSNRISDIVSKTAIDRMMKLKKIEDKLEVVKLHMYVIDQFVEKLENERGKDIMKRIYFKREKVKDVAKEQGVTHNMISKIKRRELYRLIDIYLEKGEKYGFK